MNLVGVFPPYGVEHGCVSSQGGGAGAGDSIEHYRFQYTELQSKDDEAEWRETLTCEAGTLFIII
jgi:hypothetical protein